MAFLAASVACPASVTFRAVSILLLGGSFVASTNAMTTAIRHAPLAEEADFASFGAFSVVVTLVVQAIVWTALADPLVVDLLLERKAARDA